jgi:hypothetical protein
MIAHTSFTALALFLLSVGSAVRADPPIEPTPGYQHDRFVTEPRNHAVEFQAYISGFDNSGRPGDRVPARSPGLIGSSP